MVNSLCIVILAGGQSSRMGKPKELLEWQGKPLILHMLEQILPLHQPCVIVTNDPRRLPPINELGTTVFITGDLVASHGPISGIYSSMCVRQEEWYLVVSCDLPFLRTEHLQRLLKNLNDRLDQDINAVVAKTGGRLQPLLALYHQQTKEIWKDALDREDYRVMHALEEMVVKEVTDESWDDLVAFNMNTPADYEEAKKEWNSKNLLGEEK
ncbi:molybdenum cofactor guanylyltransferase [Brevibacillus laterosporus]|uniref:Probable molybdenum cofactor guanylyltransferase n=1 Tax=Brevibacillus laterosporus TaxID=1465 RepID=A0AAP3DG70_BRELA|nr:molybdenum cofactor guanylyltransferase [Brevibacillus laterosporus]MCR8980694.1 molybdenum cofactor guanylyltransferase [Brevibacillus laterosporus]MCZ0807849.1 molybdenum cofactor guanylyltransferase [Brevibacillus laterosporus]MCZ0826125.1 molybdenum cofactor guanylyltransferase [Brevibacillus laterosporus]MCZ0849708.1 molybdenum cofactor guanylyltransferase [Brevibacillus laterosporus]PPA92824.1 molybdenum cofactor guanylyltransferase [Brevibacillus laterosporus]